VRVIRRSEGGSVLALVPAAFLVLIILGALAVDSAATYLAQRQLRDALSAAAADAVGAGLSRSSFYAHGAVTLSLPESAPVVCQSVAAQADGDLHHVRLWIAVAGPAIRLEGTASVDTIFGRDIPGFGVRQVRASTTAIAATGPLESGRTPNPPAAAALQPISCA
jgi:hypothetical protein